MTLSEYVCAHNDFAILLRATMHAAHAVCDYDADRASSNCLLDGAVQGAVPTGMSDRSQEAAIRRQGRTRQIARILRTEEQNGASDFLRPTGSLQMHLPLQNVIDHLISDYSPQTVMHGSVDQTRANDVYPDAL